MRILLRGVIVWFSLSLVSTDLEAQETKKDVRFELTQDEKDKEELVLTIVNLGKVDRYLDGALLNPVVFLQIRDEKGDLVGKIPRSVPRPVTEENLYLVKAGSKERILFSLSEVTMANLAQKKLTLACGYDARPEVYPKKFKHLAGVYRSNELTFIPSK